MLRVSTPDSDTDASLAKRLNDFRRTKLYDFLAAAPFIAWCAYSATQLLPDLTRQIALAKFCLQTDASVLRAPLILSIVSSLSTLLFLAVLIVLFALRRVSRHSAPGLYPRFVAVVATFVSVGIVWLPLQELSSFLYLGALLSIIGGMTVAISSALALGRSISLLPEARRLVTRGPYSLVRHPLYVGEIIAIVGIAVLHWSPWALSLLAVQCLFTFQRMKIEETMLVQVFPEYREYMARTARFVPGVY